MMTVDEKTKEFVRLVEVAISIVSEMRASPNDSAVTTLENLKGFRDLALAGKLPIPSKGEVPLGTGLGLTRNIGEWTENDELLDAAYEIEEFYKRAM